VNSDYYLGRAILDIGYRNYFHLPFYWGCGGNIEAGLPGSEFPYTYSSGSYESLNAPVLYGASAGACFGLVYYNRTFDFSVFTEVGGGANARILFNNSFQYAHSSKLYPGFFGNFMAGIQWKWFRVWGGIEYDSNLTWNGKVLIGTAIPTSSFKVRKKAKNQLFHEIR